MEAIKKSGQKHKQRIVVPAIKPGTRSAYLWELPDEEINRMLREHGVDVEELNRILAEGGGTITFNHAKTNQSIEEKNMRLLI